MISKDFYISEKHKLECYFTGFCSFLRTHSFERLKKHFLFNTTFSSNVLKFVGFGNNIKDVLDLVFSSWLHSYTTVYIMINTRVTPGDFDSLLMINMRVTTSEFDSLLISFQGFLLLFSGLITAIVKIFVVFIKVPKWFWLWLGCVLLFIHI